MTDKEKIREEIERLKLCTMDEHMKFYSEAAEAEYNALCKVEKTIDSLQEEPLSEDLEEASVEWFNSVKYKSDLSGTPISAFKAGAEWQKQQTVNKACKLLDENIEKYISADGECNIDWNFINDFKKRLEE